MTGAALKYITPREYLEAEELSEEKHEYFDGQIIAMAGARIPHNQVVANLIGELHGALKGKGCRVYPSDLRISTPSSNAYMYPDVSIVCGKTEKKDGEFDTCTNPTVIIEVMSDSTRNNDRGYKFFYYQQITSLKEYILVDSTNYFIQSIYRQPGNLWKFDKIETINAALTIHSIGLSLSLSDIYYEVPLP